MRPLARTCTPVTRSACHSSLRPRSSSAAFHTPRSRSCARDVTVGRTEIEGRGRVFAGRFRRPGCPCLLAHAAANSGGQGRTERVASWKTRVAGLWSFLARAWAWFRPWAVPVGACCAVAAVLLAGCAVAMSAQEFAALASMTSGVKASVSDSSQHTWRWLMYKIQKFCSQHILARLFVVVLMSIPCVGLFGYAYNRTSGASLGKSLFKTYAVLQRVPGANACDDSELPSVWVMNLVHAVGLFTYALILGLVAEAVQSATHNFKKGNGEVVEHGHTVIMHTNTTTKAMLTQWARGQSERGKHAPIVILSNRDKADLDDFVTRVRNTTGLDLQAREGKPESADDLRLVSAQHAANIIVMDPQYGADAHERDRNLQPFAAALVNMAGLGSNAQFILQLPPEYTVSEDYQRDAFSAAVRLHNTPNNGNRVLAVTAIESLREARTQCAVCPGIAEFYTHLFCHGDHDEVYCDKFKELDGLTYKDARRRFAGSTILGYYRPKTGVHANPPDTDVLQSGDWLIGLSADQKSFVPMQPDYSSFFGMDGQSTFVAKRQGAIETAPRRGKWKVRAGVPDMRAKNIIVAAFHKPATATLETLAATVPRGAELTVICPEKVPAPRGPFKVNVKQGHPGCGKLLKQAGIERADSLMLCGLHNYPDNEADIQVLTSVAQIADMMAHVKRARPLHVVADSRGLMLEEFADRLHVLRAQAASIPSEKILLTTDILPTESLSAGYLAQAGMQPELAFVLRELFDAKDVRVSITHPLTYMRRGETVLFDELSERARANKETIVGFVNHETNGETLTRKDAQVKWEDVQSIIVLTG